MTQPRDRRIKDAERRRVLGENAACRKCGFTGLAALQRDDDGIICYGCESAKAGRPSTEDHHPFGRSIEPGIKFPIDGTMHRMVSDMEYENPEEVRANTDRDPILLVTGFITSVCNLARFVVTYGPKLVPWLVLFYHRLVERQGSSWWEYYDMPPLWGMA